MSGVEALHFGGKTYYGAHFFPFLLTFSSAVYTATELSSPSSDRRSLARGRRCEMHAASKRAMLSLRAGSAPLPVPSCTIVSESCPSMCETRRPGSRIQSAGEIAARTMRTGRKSVRCEGTRWENGCTSPRQCGTIYCFSVGDLFTSMVLHCNNEMLSVAESKRRKKTRKREKSRDNFVIPTASLYVICG